MEDTKKQSCSMSQCMLKLKVNALLAKWRALLAVKESQYDDTQSSGAADEMDRRAARAVKTRGCLSETSCSFGGVGPPSSLPCWGCKSADAPACT